MSLRSLKVCAAKSLYRRKGAAKHTTAIAFATAAVRPQRDRLARFSLLSHGEHVGIADYDVIPIGIECKAFPLGLFYRDAIAILDYRL